jgi:hypothetical protein
MAVEIITTDGTVPVPVRTTAATNRSKKRRQNRVDGTVAYRRRPCLGVANGPTFRRTQQIAADARQ